jgi:hypothetical protein
MQRRKANKPVPVSPAEAQVPSSVDSGILSFGTSASASAVRSINSVVDESDKSTCNNSAVPAFPEVISLISSEDEGKKKRALPAVPKVVVSLLSSDDESDDKIPQSQFMVGQVAITIHGRTGC